MLMTPTFGQLLSGFLFLLGHGSICCTGTKMSNIRVIQSHILQIGIPTMSPSTCGHNRHVISSGRPCPFLLPPVTAQVLSLSSPGPHIDSGLNSVIYPSAIPMGSSLPHFLAKLIVAIPGTLLFRNPQHPYILKPAASRYLMPLRI